MNILHGKKQKKKHFREKTLWKKTVHNKSKVQSSKFRIFSAVFTWRKYLCGSTCRHVINIHIQNDKNLQCKMLGGKISV